MAEREPVEGEAWIEQHRKGSDAQFAGLFPRRTYVCDGLVRSNSICKSTGPRGDGTAESDVIVPLHGQRFHHRSGN